MNSYENISDDDLVLMIRGHFLSFARIDAVDRLGIRNIIKFTGNQWNEDFDWTPKLNALSREDKLRVLEACKSVD